MLIYERTRRGMKRDIRKVLIIAVCMVFSLTLVSLGVIKLKNGAEIVTHADSVEPDSLREVNALRKEKGISSLNWNSELEKAASDKAKDIVENNYFDHVSPSGKKAWDFILQENYDYKYAGENLALNFSSVEDATVAWKESPSHYANIISPKYSDFGYAKIDGVVGGKKTTVYVEIFASKIPKYERVVSSGEGGSDVN